MAPPISAAATLRARLHALSERLAAVRLALPAAATVGDAAPHDAADLIDRYLIPRLGEPEAPLVVVIFGPTGSGKSTLVNSLAGRTISEAGALRPTTSRPVVWCHDEHRERYDWGDGADLTVVVDDDPLLRSLTLVDTPDLDSYVERHRLFAESVLLAADAAIFVTTPQRYADAVPWTVVRRLTEREMPLLVIANRLSRRSSGAVKDLAGLLRSNGVEAARADDIVRIQEHRLRGEGYLPKSAIERVRERLESMADRRLAYAGMTVDGSAGWVLRETEETLAAIDRQHAEAETWWTAVHEAYRSQTDEIARHLDSAELVRGEVVTRWQRMVGVSDLAAIVSRGWARLQDVLRGGSPVEADQIERVGEEARRELIDLAVLRTQRAVAGAVNAWEVEPGARDLLSSDLRRVGTDLERRAGDEVDAWLAGLVQLISEEGKTRFPVARMASFGINAASTMLLLGVFASTGGITGAEVGVVAGAAAAQQTVLERLFGSAAASRLARKAKLDLMERYERLLAEDAQRFRAVLDARLDDAEDRRELERVAVATREALEAISRG